jgi:hypothetical protein
VVSLVADQAEFGIRRLCLPFVAVVGHLLLALFIIFPFGEVCRSSRTA